MTLDCQRFQEILYGWDLRLLVPVREICRPRIGVSDDRLLASENVRVWENADEVRLMAHLIQEKGKRRKKYLEVDRKQPLQRMNVQDSTDTSTVCQEGIELESKGKGQNSILRLTGINTAIEESELERRGSTSSLSSVSSGNSLKRRLSWNQSSPILDKVDIHFRSQQRMLLLSAIACLEKY